ncbi:MAG: hypothetical protein K0Q55_1268 [Verrucomicrobia bacterium]|jgi:hypothetical protein|nr:hypothetical protein [Verrucomicrobiota bacterium]
MRKPLLDKYRSAEPALDAIRSQVIASELSAEPPLGFWATLWLELFVKPRLAWGGMGAAWLVALILNVSSGSEQPVTQMARQPKETTQEVMQMVREQQRMRDELLGIGVVSVDLSPADRPRDGLKPRSERREEFAVV